MLKKFCIKQRQKARTTKINYLAIVATVFFGHGNTKTLKELIENDPKYGRNFQFSILMLLPKTITPDEAIRKERLYKNKLGTNSFGLNNN